MAKNEELTRERSPFQNSEEMAHKVWHPLEYATCLPPPLPFNWGMPKMGAAISSLEPRRF